MKNPQKKINDIHQTAIEKLRIDLIQACETSLRLPEPGSQYVVVADASFLSAGYVLVIEDNTKFNLGTKKNLHACVNWFQSFQRNSSKVVNLRSKNFWRSTLHSIPLPTFCGKAHNQF